MTAQNEEKMVTAFELRHADAKFISVTLVEEFNAGYKAAIAQGEQERKFLLETVESLQFQLGDKIMKFEFQLSESQKREAALQAEMDELKRKLAEQQATMYAVLVQELADKHGKEELTNLLVAERNNAYSKLEFIRHLKGPIIGGIAIGYSNDEGGFTIVKECPASLVQEHEAEARAAERNKVLAEMSHMEPVGYVRSYGVECLQGTLMNQTTGRIPLPSSTTIDPYPVTDDDIPLYVIPESPQPAAQSEGE